MHRLGQPIRRVQHASGADASMVRILKSHFAPEAGYILFGGARANYLCYRHQGERVPLGGGSIDKPPADSASGRGMGIDHSKNDGHGLAESLCAAVRT